MDIDGNFVVFGGSKNPEAGIGDGCVFIYDIQAQKTFRVSPEYSDLYSAAIGGGRIAWMTPGTETGTKNLYTALLPEPGDAPVQEPDIPTDIAMEDVALLPTGTTRDISVGKGITFDHNGDEHSIIVTGITSGGATIEVYSDPMNATLTTGETIKLDTDGDGLKDLSVTLESTDTAEQTAEITILSISEGGGLLPFPGVGAILLIMLVSGLAIAVVRKRKNI
jgi:hypothetical protein